ncbi:hypothetical protein Y032_0066g3780 [Ancylostoma ceylanicum]|uniref:N-acetyl-D-glucosamine kinase n=1 Tax=Ancylostoma ceylanicum TaxID=53326 RepID=A0A016U1I6_9BILA|nr:hypothetical protein Y032_0066g3780 [Ancylostoma ceylanicum]
METGGIGANQTHWKGVWPSAQHLGNFLCANEKLFHDSVCLELGSGTGAVGLALGKLGAKKVILTDYPKDEILTLLRENVEKNQLENKCEVRGLDWQSTESIAAVVGSLNELDFLIGSDIFYDVCTFQPLMTTITTFFDKFPRLRFYLGYAERDDNWSIEDLLFVNNLQARLIQSKEDSGATVQIGVIYRNKMTGSIFCGIEGGATESHLVFVNTAGQTIGNSTTGGTNYNLDGIEKTVNNVAAWIRDAARKNDIQLPVKGLGLGLSGAEGARDNARFVEYLQTHHGDIAEQVFLTSDSVATVAAAFEHGGVVLISGTGSSCRVLLDDGRVFGVGGWGHVIGDGGSAFWIAIRAIRLIFDEDDGMETPHESTALIRKLMLQHFKIEDKVDILEHLYNKFQKSNIASFTKVMAQHPDDPAIRHLLFDAGEILGRQFVVAASHLPSEYREEVNLVVVGSVFKSWEALKPGFARAIQGSWIPRVNLYRPAKSKAFGAAALVAIKCGTRLPHPKNAEHFETLEFYE